jgi:hypothetical protein
METSEIVAVIQVCHRVVVKGVPVAQNHSSRKAIEKASVIFASWFILHS